MGTGNCSAGSCSLGFNAPVGNDRFHVAVYDAQNGTGHKLADGQCAGNIQGGQTNALYVTLGGVAAKIAVTALSPSLQVGVPASAALSVVAYDAAGSAIIGPGLVGPDYIKLASAEPAISFSSTSASFQQQSGDVFVFYYNGQTPLATSATITASNGDPALTVVPATITFAARAAGFSANGAAGVSFFQQSAPDIEAFLAPSSTAAIAGIFADRDTYPIVNDSVTVTMSGAYAPFAHRAAQPKYAERLRELLPDGALPALVPQARVPASHRLLQAHAYTPPVVGTQRTMYVIQQSGLKAPVAFTLQHIAAHGYIWIDDALKTVDAGAAVASASALGADFDKAYASDVTHFGSTDYGLNAAGIGAAGCDASGASTPVYPSIIADADPGKVHVLIVAPQNMQYVGGYFDGNDLMPQTTTLNCFGMHSNEQPDIYVNWQMTGDQGRTMVQSVGLADMAHELQHLINFVNHSVRHSGNDEDQWINEGLSVLAQDFVRPEGYDVSGSMHEARAYLKAPHTVSIRRFADSTGALGCFACYGGSYLFMRYMTDRFGPGFALKMDSHPNGGIENILAATGQSNFYALWNDFGAMLAVSNTGMSADPRYNLQTWSLHGTYYEALFNDTYTLSGPTTIGTLSPGATVSMPNMCSGCFAYFDVTGLGGSGNAIKATGTAGGLGLAGAVGQQ